MTTVESPVVNICTTCWTPRNSAFFLIECVYIFLCFHRAFCTVYYPDQQMHNIYINNILCILSTHTCFDDLNHIQGVLSLCFAKVTKSLKLQLNKGTRLKFSRDRCCVIKSIKY
jgi:hypothetical protein